VVATHNQLRGYHYLGSVTTGGVQWDATLAAGAQAWAQQCEFQHSNSGACRCVRTSFANISLD
jgi:uncharacterized protein YkwD